MYVVITSMMMIKTIKAFSYDMQREMIKGSASLQLQPVMGNHYDDDE